MSLFMDVHNIEGGVSATDVAEAFGCGFSSAFLTVDGGIVAYSLPDRR